MAPPEEPCRLPGASQPPLRRGRRPRAAPLALVATAAALLSAPGALRPAREATTPLAASLFAAGGRPKVLFQWQDYELLWRPRKKGKVFPRVELRKTPPRPLALGGMSADVEGPLDKDFAGFPFTTRNAGSVQLDFPRVSGRLKLSLEDPPAGAAAPDGEEQPQGAGEVAYEQRVPGLGEVSLRAKQSGEWGASFSREVEDLGRLSGSVNSQLDWNLDLESKYPAVRGFVPSATYGATQDGMRVRASMEGLLDKNLHGSYSVQNEAGQYAPADLRHDATLTLSSGSRAHVLEAKGSYDRRQSQVPVRGSLAYRAQLRPATLEASVDNDRYRLSAKAGPGQVSAALARKPDEAGTRPAELELKLGKVTAGAVLGQERPRLRLGVAL